jgi:hypothetical protein
MYDTKKDKTYYFGSSQVSFVNDYDRSRSVTRKISIKYEEL